MASEGTTMCIFLMENFIFLMIPPSRFAPGYFSISVHMHGLVRAKAQLDPWVVENVWAAPMSMMECQKIRKFDCGLHIRRTELDQRM